MKSIQPKTLELLIIRNLRLFSPRTIYAFERLLQHFIDDDFVFGCNHAETIFVIYKTNFYKRYNVSALSSKLNLDTKTLLCRRKAYLMLFAKYYLNLTIAPNNIFTLLYDALLQDLQNANVA